MNGSRFVEKYFRRGAGHTDGYCFQPGIWLPQRSILFRFVRLSNTCTSVSGRLSIRLRFRHVLQSAGLQKRATVAGVLSGLTNSLRITTTTTFIYGLQSFVATSFILMTKSLIPPPALHEAQDSASHFAIKVDKLGL